MLVSLWVRVCVCFFVLDPVCVLTCFARGSACVRLCVHLCLGASTCAGLQWLSMYSRYGDIPYDLTAWTHPDIINSDWLDKRGKEVYSVTGDRYCLNFRKYILL